MELEIESLSHQKSKLEETCAVADRRIDELLADLDNEKDVIRDLEDQLEFAQVLKNYIITSIFLEGNSSCFQSCWIGPSGCFYTIRSSREDHMYCSSTMRCQLNLTLLLVS
jgi:hypothetical protein